MSAQEEGGREAPKPKGKVRAGLGRKDSRWGLESPQIHRKVTSTSWGLEGLPGWGGRALRAMGPIFLPVPSRRVGVGG